MANEMKRGRSQTIWRYTPEATFRYNDSYGWCRVGRIGIREKEALSGPLAEALAQALRKWNAMDRSHYPDPITQASKYEVGTPDHVEYSLWPLVFECRVCRRVQYYQTLERLKEQNDRLTCRDCSKGGNRQATLRQLPYVYICECGRLQEPFVRSCPTDRKHRIKLIDRGNFRDSYWLCMDCGTRLSQTAREGLGVRNCDCAPGKSMRGITLLDTRLFFSQTLQIVDIRSAALGHWKENPNFSDFLLCATLRAEPYKSQHLLDLAKSRSEAEALSPELQAVVQQLVASGKMSHAEALATVGLASKSVKDVWHTYKTSAMALGALSGGQRWDNVRSSREYLFVRDDPGMDTLHTKDLLADATAQGDTKTVDRLKREQQLARDLGLANLQVVQNLPILLAGYGYTRYFQTPADGGADAEEKKALKLRPFPAVDMKVPIYIARNTTEALLFELDPWRVAAFLSLNLGFTPPPAARASEAHLSAWLIGVSARLASQGESHLELKWFEQEAGLAVDAPSALLFGLLHSISHVLKATAHLYVGVDADSIAEYLFAQHQTGMLYVSSHVEFNLGGMSSVFRSNMTQWLGSCRDFAIRCSFDPVCIDGGGACLACLYTKFGCGYFNRTLSRAFLMGGFAKGREARLVGYWEPRTVELAETLRRGAA